MAGVTRFELATSYVTGRRSNQLSYTPIKKNNGGHNRTWTYDPLLVRQVLSQLSYATILKLVVREGFEPSKAVLADLQSAPFDHSGTSPSTSILNFICTLLVPRRGIEPLFPEWKSDVLTVERTGHKNGAAYRNRTNHLLITSQLLYQMS